MPSTLFVMLGGAIGAALRYHIGRLLIGTVAGGWPMATLLVNVVGGFAMGLLAGWLHRNSGGQSAAEPWRLLLGVGVLGGFTTFSAFSLEMVQLIESSRWTAAAGYALASVILSIAALFAGLSLVRAL